MLPENPCLRLAWLARNQLGLKMSCFLFSLLFLASMKCLFSFQSHEPIKHFDDAFMTFEMPNADAAWLSWLSANVKNNIRTLSCYLYHYSNYIFYFSGNVEVLMIRSFMPSKQKKILHIRISNFESEFKFDIPVSALNFIDLFSRLSSPASYHELFFFLCVW